MNITINKIKIILQIFLISMFLNGGVSYASSSSIIRNESPVLITESNENNSIISENNSIISENNSIISENNSIISENNSIISENNSAISGNNVTLGGGSLSKAEGYVETKLFDVVGFFQACIKPLTYVTFILSIIMVLFGVVTDSKSKFKGFLGMAFSIFVYVSVVFAPQIVEYFSSWLAVI